MRIDTKELDKPILKKPDGTFVTLREVVKGTVRAFATLGPEDYRDLALVRFEVMDQKKAFSVVGKGTFTKEQILTEIRRGTEAGNFFVKMQETFIRYLLNRKGEIDVT
jgi:hypothetical protein